MKILRWYSCDVWSTLWRVSGEYYCFGEYFGRDGGIGGECAFMSGEVGDGATWQKECSRWRKWSGRGGGSGSGWYELAVSCSNS